MCAFTRDVLGQDFSKVRAKASPQQHVTALLRHATGHHGCISTDCPSVAGQPARSLHQFAEEGFIHHKTPVVVKRGGGEGGGGAVKQLDVLTNKGESLAFVTL